MADVIEQASSTQEADQQSAVDNALANSGDQGGSPAAGGDGTPAEFVPNWKLSVMDQEHEIDEFYRPLVKDETSFNKVKELYEKALGLDHVKPKYESAKAELDEMRPAMQTFKKDMGMLGQYLQNQDLGSFFNSFKLTDEVILKYALERLEYLEAPQEKRSQMDQAAKIRADHAKLALENQDFKAQQQERQHSDLQSQFETSIKAPHVSTIAQNFDARAGKPNAFRDAALQHGITASRLAGRHLPPDEVMQSFITTFGLTALQAGQPAQAAAQVPAGSGQPAAREATIPKVNGTSATPVKTKIRSIDDIRKASVNLSQTNR